MNVKFLAVVVFAAILAGCSESGQETASSASPAAQPTVSASVDHAAMGHDASASDRATNHAMGTSGMQSLQGKSGEAFDKAYLSQMIAHHEAAVQMAKGALTTATKPETKQEAQKIVDSQTKEVAQMTGWLQTWYKSTPDESEQALVKADMKQMMAMPISTDAMFFEMMIPHHQGAIDMSELALKNAGRDEVKELARKIIAAQKSEIAEYHRLMGHGN
jgi:uncharacterized protein (DUF305 family)